MSSSPAPHLPLRIAAVVLAALVVLAGCRSSDPPTSTRTVGGEPAVASVVIPRGGALPAVACDWDGDGTDTYATVTGGRWMVRDADGGSRYVDSVLFGLTPGDVPLCGDWDGDGDDEPGIYRSGTFHLRSDLTSTTATIEVPLDGGGAPVVGDWDGDGTDTVGLFSAGRWTLTSAPTGVGPLVATHGTAPDDRPVVGDWDGDGIDTIGVVRGSDWLASDLPHSAAGQTFRGGGIASGVPLAVSPGDGAADVPTLVHHDAAGTTEPVDVHLFGDSLAVESHAAFVAAMTTGRNRPVAVTYSSWGGTAICDYHDEIAGAPGRGAEAIVISFSGNNITGCTLLQPGEGSCRSWAPDDERAHVRDCRKLGDDLYQQYLDDARWAVASVAPTPVMLVAPPTMADPVAGANPRPGTGREGDVWRAYLQVAAEFDHVTLVDGGRYLTPDDRWVEEALCLPGEICEPLTTPTPGSPPTGVLRSPDGVHLCDPRAADRRSEVDGCDPLLPGPFRFAGVAADAVAYRLGL